MLISLTNVSHEYQTGGAVRKVLRDVNLSFDQARVGVIGHNGSGKSTFARLLNGLIIPTHGQVSVDGFSTADQVKQVRQRVGFLFTDPDAQIIMPTVAEDVAFGLRKSGLPKAERQQLVMELLTRFGLAEHADHPAHLLSGGQKQLLALASVLITGPQLVVMDEPTTLLDLRNAAMIRRVIAELDQQVVLVTHHLDQLRDFDRVIVFDDGQIVADDEPGPAIDCYLRLMAAEL